MDTAALINEFAATAAIAAIVIAGVLLIQAVKRRYGDDEIWTTVLRTVEAVEQTMAAEPGEKRRAEAIRQITEIYPDMDAARLHRLIEAAVWTVNLAQRYAANRSSPPQ